MNERAVPRFTGLFIPVEILEMDLTLLEKMLLAWLDALYCKERGGCFAKNEYLAEKLGVQENTIAKALTHLRSLGLIEDVSFDGRNRVIRSLIYRQADKEQFSAEKSQSNAGLDLNPSRVGFKSNAGLDENPSSPYRDKRRYTKRYTPPIPPQSQNSANAEEVEGARALYTHSRKKSADFPAVVHALVEELIASLLRIKPDFVVPRNLCALLTQVDFMLRIDKRSADLILDVFNWALSDAFWCDKLYKPNPVKYLREHFDQLQMKMNAKAPETKKPRKFAQYSRQEVLDEMAEQLRKDME